MTLVNIHDQSKHTSCLFRIVVEKFANSLFFLEPVESIRGKLAVMIRPARTARSTRKSWIPCRSGVVSLDSVILIEVLGH